MDKRTKNKIEMPVVRLSKILSWIIAVAGVLLAVMLFISGDWLKAVLILLGMLATSALLRLLAVLTQMVLGLTQMVLGLTNVVSDTQALLCSDLRQGTKQITTQITDKLEQFKKSTDISNQTIVEKIIEATGRINVLTRDSEIISQQCKQITTDAKQISQYCKQINCDTKDVNKNVFSMHDFFEKIAKRLDIHE